MRSTRAYRAVRERLGLVTATLAEDIAGMRMVQAFTREEQNMRNFRAVTERYRESNMQTVVLNGWYFPFVDLLSSVALAVVLGYGGHLYFNGAVTIGTLFAFMLYVQNFFDPGAAALAALQHVPVGDGGARQDHGRAWTRSRRSSTGPTPSALPQVAGSRPLRGRAVQIRHRARRSCTASTSTCRRERRSRSSATPAPGKSTIAKLLARFYDPTDGRITIDGHDLRDVTQASLRRQLGIVPQEGFLFAGTVTENIAFGRPDATPEEVVRAAQAVGAHDFILRLEDGYETQLQERGSRLSLGQRQLIALARALLADPRILILDEATSSVDIGTERKIEQALRLLLAGRTAFIIAHRLSTIRDADLIVVLEHGQIVEQGSHDELLRAPRPLHVAVRGLGRRLKLAGSRPPMVAAYGAEAARDQGRPQGHLAPLPTLFLRSFLTGFIVFAVLGLFERSPYLAVLCRLHRHDARAGRARRGRRRRASRPARRAASIELYRKLRRAPRLACSRSRS